VLYAEPISNVMCKKFRVSTCTLMSHYKCEGPNKSQSLLLRKLARYFNKHEETGRTATVMQSLGFLFCVYLGVHSFCALLFKTATYECVQCL
jgi:hypothetical protein